MSQTIQIQVKRSVMIPNYIDIEIVGTAGSRKQVTRADAVKIVARLRSNPKRVPIEVVCAYKEDEATLTHIINA